jgi:tRNA-splicing ligase RtcB
MYVLAPDKNTGMLPIKCWASNLEDVALEQAENIAKLPFAYRHVALMPDAHMGYGMPIGGVLATIRTVIPNAVGVDIGCGMCACKVDTAYYPKDKLKEIMGKIRKAVPVGFNHHKTNQEWEGFDTLSNIPVIRQQLEAAKKQLGTLGGGNHFIELQHDERDQLWVMIHSGSRNFGLKIAKDYHDKAVLL